MVKTNRQANTSNDWTNSSATPHVCDVSCMPEVQEVKGQFVDKYFEPNNYKHRIFVAFCVIMYTSFQKVERIFLSALYSLSYIGPYCYSGSLKLILTNK